MRVTILVILGNMLCEVLDVEDLMQLFDVEGWMSNAEVEGLMQ